jgi:hypothetical protein
MKKLYIIAILAATTGSSAFSQKLLKPEVDLIKGDTTYSTSQETLHSTLKLTSSSQLKAAIVKSGRQFVLALTVKSQSMGGHPEIYSIVKDQKAYLKLDDNSLVTLLAVGNKVTDANVGMSGSGAYAMESSTSSMMMWYFIEPTDVQKLTEHGVKVVRLETSNANLDYEIKEKNAKVISSLLQLFKSAKTT